MDLLCLAMKICRSKTLDPGLRRDNDPKGWDLQTITPAQAGVQ
jgi:hypothetical protein